MNHNNRPHDLPSAEEIEQFNDRLTAFAAVIIAIGVILGCFSYAKVEELWLQVVLFIGAGFLVLFGCFLILVVKVGSKQEVRKVNLFLFDRKEGQPLSPDDLTIETVRERICAYMSAFKHRGKLYIGELFDDPHISEPLKTLFCYELLCQIAEDGGEKAKIFLSYGYECSQTFADYLTACEDYDLAQKLKCFALDFPKRSEILQEFTCFMESQKEHLQEKMLDYTVRNIDKF